MILIAIILLLREWLSHLCQPKSGNRAALLMRLNSLSPKERGVCPSVPKDLEENVEQENKSDCNYAEKMSENDRNFEKMSENDRNFEKRSENDRNVEKKNGNVCSNEIQAEQNICNNDAVESVVANREIELLKREMALLVKEKQLLQKENALLMKVANVGDMPTLASPQETDFSFDTIKELLPEFDGNGNVHASISQLLNVGKLCTLRQDIMKALLMCKHKGSARMWLISKTDYASTAFEVLIEDMREAFKQHGSKLQQRRKFEDLIWVYGEDFSKYYNDKMLLANDLQLEEPELIEYLIEGISDLQLRTQASISCFESAEKILRAFSKVALRKPYKTATDITNVERTAEGAIRCYNCNSIGHFATNCLSRRQPRSQSHNLSTTKDGPCY